MPAIFQPQIALKNQQGTLSVRVIIICSDRKLLLRNTYKGVGRTSTMPDSILHKIIIIIIILKNLQNAIFPNPGTFILKYWLLA